MPSLMNRSEIMEVLPQKPPFLLIDDVKGLMPGENIKAVRNIEFNDNLSEGNGGLVPAGISLEMMMQAISLCVLSLPEHKNKVVFLEEIKKTTVTDDIEKGNIVDVEGTVLRIRRDMVTAKAIAFVEGKKKISAEFLFRLEERIESKTDLVEEEETKENIAI